MLAAVRRACGGAAPGEQREEDDRLLLLRRKLEEVEHKLSEEAEEAEAAAEGAPAPAAGPSAAGLSDRVVVRFPEEREEVVVIIGTSRHIQVPGLPERICRIVDAAYSGAGKHKRVGYHDALQRLEMGDAGPRSNRVLHLAYKGEELVGCASSTFSPGWTPEGCGHWGLLAVDPAHQGGGVATALVLAAERRLATVSEMIQIEYEYTAGEEFSQRLMAWYEGRLGFDGGPKPTVPGRSCFRRCFKQISEEDQRRGRRRRLQEIRNWLKEQITEAEASMPVSKNSTPSTRCPEEVAGQTKRPRKLHIAREGHPGAARLR